MVSDAIRSAAKLVRRFRVVDGAGGLEEGVIWRIPVSERYPEGIRYRLAYVPKGSKSPAILYDNHHPKGHHKHMGERQVPYEFVGMDRLLEDFSRDIEALK